MTEVVEFETNEGFQVFRELEIAISLLHCIVKRDEMPQLSPRTTLGWKRVLLGGRIIIYNTSPGNFVLMSWRTRLCEFQP